MGKKNQQQPRTLMNNAIRSKELRVIDLEEGNLGVLSRDDALEKAQEQDLDLIVVSPEADPPVAKIMDYGKYQYEQKKKQKEQKNRETSTGTEVKNVQVKIGTGENDVAMKAKKASQWLSEGHRVKGELYVKGRAKSFSTDFHHKRLQRLLDLITEEYKVVEDIKKCPKGYEIIIEPAKKK